MVARMLTESVTISFLFLAIKHTYQNYSLFPSNSIYLCAIISAQGEMLMAGNTNEGSFKIICDIQSCICERVK